VRGGSLARITGPLVVLVLVLGGVLAAAPALERGAPAPDVTVTHHTIPDDETIVLHVTNSGPETVTIAQVLVDEAYWNFTVDKQPRLPGLPTGEGPTTLAAGESARVVIPYHLTVSPGAALETGLVLDDGGTIEHEIAGVQTTPALDGATLGLLAGIGLLVGVVPVAIGMLWYPALRRAGRRWVHATLAFAGGVLAFLAVDTGLEAFQVAERVPGVFEGRALVVVAALAALLGVQAIGSANRAGPDRRGLRVAYFVAGAIGLHNLAEGLAIGSSYALGEAALATFLIVGFLLHNVTEGPAIVGPLAETSGPGLGHLAGLALLGGGPVVLGAWLGAAALSPIWATLFLAVGVGAILQVLGELGAMVREQGRVASATNLAAFVVGLGVMYLTALLVTV
jgi:zinc transporter ZupT